MIRILIICILVWCSFPAQANDTALKLIEKVKSKATNPDTIDLSPLKFDVQNKSLRIELYDWAADATNNQTSLLKGLQHESHPTYCQKASYTKRLINHLRLLGNSETAEAYQANKKMAQEAIALTLEEMKKHSEEIAASANNKITKEVAYRWSMGQLSKGKSQFLFQLGLDEKLNEATWYYVQDQMKMVMCEYDLETANWLTNLLNKEDWLNRTEYSEETDDRLAELVSWHYDHDFVEAISWRMERLSLSGKTSTENLALVKQHLSFTNAQTTAILEQFGQNVGAFFMCH
ncbi:hypothetical protein [Kordiimonas laminariae]|uniref:hypothetical protein n=1 Tax=Kordiimonas laminariae TaxID=2917717 RepID=UPI001FF17233|nr:hypothetical protein [Kordiimonas laminariae]MCK0070194.1 hypothetical protein [Kordiimonas laminariae]